MKTKSIFLVIFIIALNYNGFSQTYDKEKENFTLRFNRGDFGQEKYSQLSKEWFAVLESLGGYPELPYNDSTKRVEYLFIKEFQGIQKEIIYNRILEWSALNFGALSNVLHYSDLKAGKIILKGYFEILVKEDLTSFWGNKKETIDKKKCYQTYIFTIIDNKLKIQIVQLEYEYTLLDSYQNSNYVPERKIKQSLHSLYPVSSTESINWKGNLDMLKQTTYQINYLVKSLDSYINNFKTDYEF